MEPWYKIVTPRKEVREGRSFDPSEFAIALEQVVKGNAPSDYTDPSKFVARTSFTRALREHTALVLRRIAGQTSNSAPVLTLITQFGGGKTHTLTLLYHLANSGAALTRIPDVANLLKDAGVSTLPQTKVAVFVGNAWDPEEGRETPWIDLARQLAGEAGVALLGSEARTTPPGTDAIAKVIAAGGGSALFLFDEVLNCLNRHRRLAEPFHAFIQNLTVAVTGAERSAAVISLPRSQVEMTDWDQEWQEKIGRVVRRVAKDLIVNDEAEISEVIRKRLFDDIGDVKHRLKVAKLYADWCFERRAQLPPEWTAVDVSLTDASARDFLRRRFEASFPFHPATLTVFQRKWQSLSQFQQTRGTLAMLAQWISVAALHGYQRARREFLITIGSAPLGERSFVSTILGQLGEPRLIGAIDSDLAGPHSHAAALDADAPANLRDIHRRVGTTILFESSGGQGDKAAHLPDLRFALGEPGIETTSVDTAAAELGRRGYYIRKLGTDGYRFGVNPTLNKVVNDRRASLDDDDIRKACEVLVRKEFERGEQLPVLPFPADSADVADSTKLTVVVLSPELEWFETGAVRQTISVWTKTRGESPRLYPGSILWAVRKPGRSLKDKVETWLAWKRVQQELNEGTLGHSFERGEQSEVAAKVREAEELARDEVWATYRYVVIADRESPDGISVIDLGAGHANNTESLTSRIVAALKMDGRLNESIGAGPLDRKWPPALRESGAWPLGSLRQAFLDGSLGRLIDVDRVLKTKLPEFVNRGDFGLAAGLRRDGTYERIWLAEPVDVDEVTFDKDMFLLRKDVARALKEGSASPTPARNERAAMTDVQLAPPSTEVASPSSPGSSSTPEARVMSLSGDVPADVWNRLGTRLIPKLKGGGQALSLGVTFEVSVDAASVESLERDIRQALQDLHLVDRIRVTVR